MLTTDIEEMLDPEIRIAPMLLIVFIENAFKHSKNTVSPEIFVDIKLKVWGNSILFLVKNSFGMEQEENNMLKKSGGFGLANVTKRLDLLYSNAHEHERCLGTLRHQADDHAEVSVRLGCIRAEI